MNAFQEQLFAELIVAEHSINQIHLTIVYIIKTRTEVPYGPFKLDLLGVLFLSQLMVLFQDVNKLAGQDSH
jgi:hypothetical protein